MLLVLGLSKKLNIVAAISIILLLRFSPVRLNGDKFFLVFIFTLLGLVFSKKIVNLFSLYFFKKRLTVFNVKYLPLQFFISLKEEIIWRFLLIYFIHTLLFFITNSNFFSLVISEIISLFSFLSVHVLKNKIQLVEFFTFSIFLILTSLVFPGFNIGLHAGRNILILSNTTFGEKEK